MRGMTAKTIARKLEISHRTVEHRLDAMKYKLAVTSKAELIEKIVDHYSRGLAGRKSQADQAFL